MRRDKPTQQASGTSCRAGGQVSACEINVALRQSRRTDIAHLHTRKRTILRTTSQHHALGCPWSERCGGGASLGPQPARRAAERSLCSAKGVGPKRTHLCESFLFLSQLRKAAVSRHNQRARWARCQKRLACPSASLKALQRSRRVFWLSRRS